MRTCGRRSFIILVLTGGSGTVGDLTSATADVLVDKIAVEFVDALGIVP